MNSFVFNVHDCISIATFEYMRSLKGIDKIYKNTQMYVVKMTQKNGLICSYGLYRLIKARKIIDCKNFLQIIMIY